MSTSAVQLKVTLREIDPPIWRRVQVPGVMTLAELHEVIQTSMGWLDYHLHLFEVGGIVYRAAADLEATAYEVDADTEYDEEETTVAQIARVGGTFRYEYDFNDRWQHEVLVEEVQSVRRRFAPVCLAGERAVPPEDCGGAAGYAHMLTVLLDPTHPDHAEYVDRFGGDVDPEYFDLAATNEMLAL